MRNPAKDPIREDRIHNEAIVDAYGPEEKAMSWYYYLENKIHFPFQAKCVVAKLVSPLKKERPSKSAAWRRTMPASLTYSCSSVGRAGTWRCLYPNWLPSIRTNPPPKQSVIGITG
jgi:Calcium binding